MMVSPGRRADASEALTGQAEMITQRLFLYLFAEVYDILVLRFIPPILLGKGGETNDPYSHNLGVCRGKYNFTLYLQVA